MLPRIPVPSYYPSLPSLRLFSSDFHTLRPGLFFDISLSPEPPFVLPSVFAKSPTEDLPSIRVETTRPSGDPQDGCVPRHEHFQQFHLAPPIEKCSPDPYPTSPFQALREILCRDDPPFDPILSFARKFATRYFSCEENPFAGPLLEFFS